MNYLQYVNLLIGTNSVKSYSNGNTTPIAAMPFGMNTFTVETRCDSDFLFFNPQDHHTTGIRLTHQLSPWLGDYGAMTFLPTSGDTVDFKPTVASGFIREKTVFEPNRLKIEFLNGKVFSVPQTEGSWMLTFNKDIMMRSSCYACASKGISRRSDFTIGDLWGINEFTPELNDNKGTSLVYLHSEKALKLFDNLKKQINFKKFDDIKAPCKYNAQLINSLKLSTLRDKYFSYTENHSFDNAFNTFVRDKWFIRWVKFIRKCLSKCKQLLLKIWRKVK